MDQPLESSTYFFASGSPATTISWVGGRTNGTHSTVVHGGENLVTQRARREVARDGPEQRPEVIGRRSAVRFERGRELLPVAEFDDHALEHLVVGHFAVRLHDADAPRHGFLALVLVVENAERSGLIGQRMAHDVAFEEQLLRLLGLCSAGKTNGRDRAHCKGTQSSLCHGRASFPTEDDLLFCVIISRCEPV
jgi:hypothetical protein